MTPPMLPFAPVTSYGTPDYASLRAEHFPPAMAAARDLHLSEIHAIATNPAEATFANTFEAMERAGRDLGRVMGAFALLTSSCTDEALRVVEAEEAPRTAAHADALFMNTGLWARVQKVHAQGREGCPSDEAWRLVTTTVDAFRRHGAHLGPDEQRALEALNQQEASLGVAMQQRILLAREEGVLCTREELDGLAENEILLLDRVHGHYRLPLDNTTIQTRLADLARPDVRQKVWQASCQRNQTGEHDTRELFTELERVRSARAGLLGFPTHAHLVLDNQQTRKPERMEALLASVAGPAQIKVKEEAVAMGLAGEGSLPDRAKAEREYRERAFSLDDEAVRSYFPWNQVLDGLFRSAQALYGLTFQAREDIPVHHEDATAYEVFNEHGQAVALFLVDPWERQGKLGGAWMLDLVTQSGLLDQRPVATNHLNLAKPAPGQPALMSLDEVQTAFHEFGHALHGILSDVTYPSLSSLFVPTDFVELPSQIHEHWMLHPDLLPHYARHVETGEIIPETMVEAIRQGAKFGQGYAMAELAAAAWLDLQWHQRPAGVAKIEASDVAEFEAQVMSQGGFDPTVAPPRYGTAYFNHIWGGGYSASYGAYIASAVLECDGFAWFNEHGGMTRDNGRHFAQTVLAAGHTRPVDELYRSFRGRDPDIGALLADRGLMGATQAESKPPRPRLA
jgi:peptidyl-dipeptidase Dcp